MRVDVADAIIELNDRFVMSSATSGTRLDSAQFDLLFTELLGSTPLDALFATLEKMLRTIATTPTTTESADGQDKDPAD
jgi:hypothetical protein